MPQTTILGIDPGKATGWAQIHVNEDHTVELGLFGVTRDMTLVEIVKRIEEADVIVYEGYWIRPDKAKSGAFNWQSVPAEKTIGALLTHCKLLGKTRIEKQQPVQRVPGYGFSGQKYVAGAKGKHWQDALAHAMYYAVAKLQALPVKPKH